MKLLLRCEEDRYLLNVEGTNEPYEFTTLLNALVFANNISRDGEAPLTVIDSSGKVVDRSFVGRERW